MDLPSNTVSLWFAFIDEIKDVQLLMAYRTLLPGDEVEKLEKYRFDTHKKRYLVGRALLRTVLSRYTEIEPAQIKLERETLGRPFLPPCGTNSALQFNLSYTDGLVAVALLSDGRVGIDVENTKANIECLDIAGTYFSPIEYDELKQLPESIMKQRFFEYWTLKEAYIKARGLGLNMPLNEVNFSFPDNVLMPIQPASDSMQDEKNWQLRLLDPSADHKAALCVCQNTDIPFTLKIKRTIPLLFESDF